MKSFISIWTALILPIICLLLSSQLTKACGPDFSDYYYTYLLEHYNFKHKFYHYQFDVSNQFYDKYYEIEEQDKPAEQHQYNISAWRNYLNLPQAISDKAIEDFIYNSNETYFSDPTRKANPIEQTILNKKSNSLENYFKLLNQYQKSFAFKGDPWDYSSYTAFASEKDVTAFANTCKNEIKNTKDAFLQWRFFYLMLRAAHFNKHYALADGYFNSIYPGMRQNNSAEQFWCENIKSGIALRLKQNDLAIYYAARVFAGSPDQYTSAMNTYLFSDRKWQAALQHCKSASDSTYVFFMEGANHPYPDISFLKKAYQTDPSSACLKLLWLRESSKLEEYRPENKKEAPYIIYKYTDAGDQEINIDSLYKANQTLLAYLHLGDELLNDPKCSMKATVANMLAYYHYKQNNFKQAIFYIGKAAAEHKDAVELQQYNLLKTLIALKTENQFNTESLKEILEGFDKKDGSVNMHAAHYLLYNEIAPYFINQNDYQSAFWTYVYTNVIDADEFDVYNSDYSPECFNNVNYATYLLLHQFSLAEIENLKQQFIYQRGENALQDYFIKHVKLRNKEKLFNLVIARRYMLEQKWDKALALYEQLPEEYRNQLGLNPANFRINDTMENSEEQDLKANYTIKQILELAKTLKNNADKSELNTAKDKYLYGCLLYNLSFYGKNHYVLDNHWHHYGSRLTAYYLYDSVDAYLYNNEQDYHQQKMNPLYRNYFYLYEAEKYFQSALAGLSSMEDKAACEFLMAKCWQKRCPLLYQKNEYGWLDVVSDYYSNALKNPYFKNYNNLYANTKTYQQVYTSCSYYRMFLNAKK